MDAYIASGTRWPKPGHNRNPLAVQPYQAFKMRDITFFTVNSRKMARSGLRLDAQQFFPDEPLLDPEPGR